jgi:hypothetical protein
MCQGAKNGDQQFAIAAPRAPFTLAFSMIRAVITQVDLGAVCLWHFTLALGKKRATATGGFIPALTMQRAIRGRRRCALQACEGYPASWNVYVCLALNYQSVPGLYHFSLLIHPVKNHLLLVTACIITWHS